MRSLLILVTMLVVACGPKEEPEPPGLPHATAYVCDGFASTGGGFGLNITHLVYVFADGSVMTTCEISGGIDSNSAFRLFRAEDSGAALAMCTVTWDMDASSGGYWTFQTNTTRSTSTARYTDPNSADNGKTFPVDCKMY